MFLVDSGVKYCIFFKTKNVQEILAESFCADMCVHTVWLWAPFRLVSVCLLLLVVGSYMLDMKFGSFDQIEDMFKSRACNKGSWIFLYLISAYHVIPKKFVCQPWLMVNEVWFFSHIDNLQLNLNITCRNYKRPRLSR